MSISRPDKGTIAAENLAKEIIELGQAKDFDKLQKLISKSDTKLVSNINLHAHHIDLITKSHIHS